MPRRPAKKNKKTSKRLSVHKHSGKLLPHRHTSYWATALIVLLGGIVLAISTPLVSRALTLTSSGSINLSGMVIGPPPTTPAVITSSANGSQFQTNLVTISGTCGPDLLVKIWRNNVFAGSALCDNTGTFKLSLTLLEGQNILRVRNFDFADQPGPDSSDVTLYYQAPSTPESGDSGQPTIGSKPNPQDSTSQAKRQFIITTDTGIVGARLPDALHWKFELSGGNAPYALLVKWGDGQQDIRSIPTAEPFTLSHSYSTSGTFAVELKATDKDGSETFLQVTAIVYDRSGSAGTTSPTRPALPSERTPLYLFWKIYAVTAIALFAFWLGEKRELAWLTKRSLLKKP